MLAVVHDEKAEVDATGQNYGVPDSVNYSRRFCGTVSGQSWSEEIYKTINSASSYADACVDQSEQAQLYG